MSYNELLEKSNELLKEKSKLLDEYYTACRYHDTDSIALLESQITKVTNDLRAARGLMDTFSVVNISIGNTIEGDLNQSVIN